MDYLYYGDSHCPCCSSPLRNAIAENGVSFSNGGIAVGLDVLTAFMRRIHEGFDAKNGVEHTLWREVLRIINEGTVEGLMQSQSVSSALNHDEEFYRALRHSNEVFAAFKVHDMGVHMAQRLLTADGKLKPFRQWAEDVRDITTHHVGSWLKTEYDTAVLRAHAAADWREFERDKDVMPNLRWVKTTSPNPEGSHRQYWEKGLVLSVDDPFWDEHHPGDRWNCKCSLEQTDDPVTMPDDMEPTPPQCGLENNPGKDGHTFNDTHPYFPDSCSHCFAYRGANLTDRLRVSFLNRKKNCNGCPFVDKVIAKMKDTFKTYKIMRELPGNLSTEEKIAIAKNCMEIEKKLNIKKGKPMTVEQADKQSANPNYIPEFILDPKGSYVDKQGRHYHRNPNWTKANAEPFSINCATCAPAYVLRLRGFNVKAKGKVIGSGSLNESVSKGRSFELWKNADGTPAQPTLTFRWMTGKGYTNMTPKRYKEYFEEVCKEQGVYILTIGWKGKRRSGHATILQRDADGKLYYIEPQEFDSALGAKRPIDSLCNEGAKMPTINRGILRVDDKVFDTSWLPLFRV